MLQTESMSRRAKCHYEKSLQKLVLHAFKLNLKLSKEQLRIAKNETLAPIDEIENVINDLLIKKESLKHQKDQQLQQQEQIAPAIVKKASITTVIPFSGNFRSLLSSKHCKVYS